VKGMDVIQQSVIAHNEEWYRRNIALLRRVLASRVQGRDFPALIAFVQWGVSEKQRLQIWEQRKAEFGIADPVPDPLAEEEADLIAALDALRIGEQKP
jgi:hypothetical protein